MASLEWLQGGQPRGRLELQEGVFLRLGRSQDADGRVENDPYMSRLHVEVVLEGGLLRVRKLPNASNPVFHGGVDKAAFNLEPGDSFVVGATRFRFLGEAAPPEKAEKAAEPRPGVSSVLFLNIAALPEGSALGQEMAGEILKEQGSTLRDSGGVVVACWNASSTSGDQACRAALAMARRLAESAPALRFGIGLHAGKISAGAVASNPAVVEASGVERIAEIIGVPLIATRDAVQSLSPSSGVAATPLGRFRPVGAAVDLDLFEIAPGPADPARLAAFEDAEAALASENWDVVVDLFAGRIKTDAAARYLSGFAERCLKRAPANWRGVIEPGEK